MPTPRKRFQFKFWLDGLKPDECQLGKQLEQLKKPRKYTATIRDALTLLFSLKERRTDVLFSMFPWIVDELKPKISSGGDGGGGAVKEHLARLEQLILQQAMDNGRAALALAESKPGAPKAMSVPSFAAPVDDDDDIELEIGLSTAPSNAANNFLASLQAL